MEVPDVPAQGRALAYTCGQCDIDLGQRELRVRSLAVPLGNRAFDILEVLVRAAGSLVTKDDFMSSLWPGAIVEENTLQVHISAIRKALGSDRALLKTVSGRGYRLLGTWTSRWEAASEGPGDQAAPIAAWPMRTNLPVASTDLIGREAALLQLRDLSSAHRVVTLTGPGGIGKTRLALQVARDLLPSFGGDGWLADLATISDAGLVPSAVAAVLGLTFGDEAVSADAVTRAIGARRLLLVLDNCEHVIDSAAGFAEAIVRSCPNASILATSRELLRIEGEHAFRVPLLDVPVLDLRTRDELLQHSAVQLFISRMQTFRSEFLPDEKDLTVAAAICRRLDGIPLAIEFAAGRAATLGSEIVLSRLDERFKVLTVGRRTALPRHQTLRATLDWSYEYLPEQERALLRFVSIFPAGFTLEAAAAVMSGNGDIVDGIGNLVEKSLVDGNGGSGRWRLLETTRAYAREKLTDLGEQELAARRHADFFRDLLTRPGPAAEPQSVAERMAPYVREIDNVRAALDWAFSAAGDASLGIALTAAFVPAWLHLSLLVECRERVTIALANLQAHAMLTTRLGMQLHIALGLSLVYTTGLVARTEEVLAKGLELAEDLDDLDNQLVALWALWFYQMTSGELREAAPLADRFVAVARRSGDPADMLLGDQIIGSTMHYKGNQLEARRYFESVLAGPDPPSDWRHSMWVLSDVRVPARAMLARVLLAQGLVDRAALEAQSSSDEELVRGRPLTICTGLRYGVCSVALTTGDLATAARSVAMLTDLAERHGSAFWSRIGRCLEGALLIKQGNFAAGTASLHGALATVRNRPPDLLAVLAEGLVGIGRPVEAVATIDERLERSAKTAEQWYDPELLRIKGMILSQDRTTQSSAAEECFRSAIELAQHQGALLWELRATLNLAQLLVQQDRQEEAHRHLAPVFSRFTEGFETEDLRAAKDLLDETEPGGAKRFGRRRSGVILQYKRP
jgi:predicted ATPase/DNA-binding winged helix-turn-helix (wHTH) protein